MNVLHGSLLTAASPRRRLRATGAASLILAAASFVPAAATATSAPPSLAAVESWVRSTSPTDAAIARASQTELLRLFVRCLPLSDDTVYCLHLGWAAPGTNLTESLASIIANAAAQEPEALGSASLLDEVEALALLPNSMRLNAELEEAREAFSDAPDMAAGASRVLTIQRWLEDRAANSSVKLDGEAVILGPECDPPELCPPQSLSIMSWTSHGAEQTELNYCGPASARMAGLWKGVAHSQSWWWQYTQVYSGNPPQPQGYSSLPNIKNALNDYGGYSSSADKFHITYFTSGQKALYVSTIVDRIWHDSDPAISSVYLLDDYFPYFSRDYNSGHFQVVRGYYLYVGTTYDPHIRIFEPFNENRFWSSRPVTSGPQVVTDDQLYNATMAQPSNRIAAS